MTVSAYSSYAFPTGRPISSRHSFSILLPLSPSPIAPIVALYLGTQSLDHYLNPRPLSLLLFSSSAPSKKEFDHSSHRELRDSSAVRHLVLDGNQAFVVPHV